MEDEEIEYLIGILAESLPSKVDAMTEINNYSQEEVTKRQTQVILNFIEELADTYKTYPKRDEIIAKILKNNCQSNVEWAETIINKIEKKKDKEKTPEIDER